MHAIALFERRTRTGPHTKEGDRGGFSHCDSELNDSTSKVEFVVSSITPSVSLLVKITPVVGWPAQRRPTFHFNGSGRSERGPTVCLGKKWLSAAAAAAAAIPFSLPLRLRRRRRRPRRKAESDETSGGGGGGDDEMPQFCAAKSPKVNLLRRSRTAEGAEAAASLLALASKLICARGATDMVMRRGGEEGREGKEGGRNHSPSPSSVRVRARGSPCACARHQEPYRII